MARRCKRGKRLYPRNSTRVMQHQSTLAKNLINRKRSSSFDGLSLGAMLSTSCALLRRFDDAADGAVQIRKDDSLTQILCRETKGTCSPQLDHGPPHRTGGKDTQSSTKLEPKVHLQTTYSAAFLNLPCPLICLLLRTFRL
jgi:hypothetical protein